LSTFFERVRPYHEAAHAVVALSMGSKVQWLSLRPETVTAHAGAVSGRDTAPRVYGGSCRIDHGDAGPEVWASTVAAGIVWAVAFGVPPSSTGEPWMRLGGNSLPVVAAQSASDWEELCGLLPSEADRNALLDGVRGLLKRDQRAVVALAAALEERGSLDGPEAESMIKAALLEQC
jgi:hypothetical protein